MRQFDTLRWPAIFSSFHKDAQQRLFFFQYKCKITQAHAQAGKIDQLYRPTSSNEMLGAHIIHNHFFPRVILVQYDPCPILQGVCHHQGKCMRKINSTFHNYMILHWLHLYLSGSRYGGKVLLAANRSIERKSRLYAATQVSTPISKASGVCPSVCEKSSASSPTRLLVLAQRFLRIVCVYIYKYARKCQIPNRIRNNFLYTSLSLRIILHDIEFAEDSVLARRRCAGCSAIGAVLRQIRPPQRCG
jgi:hypothetical protein